MNSPRPTGRVPALRPAPDRELLPEEISYLVFEGGGGKGFAYLGALAELYDRDVMPVGFGGSSAGAITALLLTLGYTVEEIEMFMRAPNKIRGVRAASFTDFFDSPVYRLVPKVGAHYTKVKDEPDETKLIAQLKQVPLGTRIGMPLGAVLAYGMCGPVGAALYVGGLAWARSNLNDLLKEMESHKDEPPVPLLLSSWPEYIGYLGRDMGLFHGQAARDTFDQLIGNKFRNRSGIARSFVTFGELRTQLGKDLLVTGANLSTGLTQIFSAKHTSEFPVADAIRISMSLPYIYKPYVLTEPERPGAWPAPGVYVDGGVWNNLPFREFDEEPRPQPSDPGQMPMPQTLALRLDTPTTLEINNLGGFLGAMGQYALYGTGESQVTSAYRNRTIALDTEGLSLLDFTPDPALVKDINARSRKTVSAYFDRAKSHAG
ncbi:patatin-like phospholipase family protein [Nonomuraea glycinis]|uniref:PNPLA domain-containing protein n=1 Tax=Nonomuraea glycinis TaxID=2047744 RepID=A0A918E8V3_9ACTN|nr:patatin-like phospholipase family protein [Nonomuraea glycinis]MCA2179509.1 patatin-like phospholipase family protein [Nonomuraea glycinis]GGP15497.1 hypothetical protein GCM10012278_75600 [Nonomuraea glycinis]